MTGPKAACIISRVAGRIVCLRGSPRAEKAARGTQEKGAGQHVFVSMRMYRRQRLPLDIRVWSVSRGRGNLLRFRLERIPFIIDDRFLPVAE